jgi:hypothetical protein
VIEGHGIMHVEARSAGAFRMSSNSDTPSEAPQRATFCRHQGHRDHRFIAFCCAISEDLEGR